MRTNPLLHFLRFILVAMMLATANAAAENRSDLWWNPAESGRGLIVIDHETNIVAVWCTYVSNGAAIWYVIPGGTLSADGRVFEGTYYRTATMGYGEVSDAGADRMGTARIEFGSGDLAYTMIPTSGPAESHQLTRHPFGTGSPAWGTDATDMWWDLQNPGWGVAVIQHGGDLLAVVLTYDYRGGPVFFVAPVLQQAAVGEGYDGKLYATQAAAGTFDPASLRVAEVGTASMRFSPLVGGTRPELMNFAMDAAWVPQPVLRRLPF
jgi:hypothetical protein